MSEDPVFRAQGQVFTLRELECDNHTARPFSHFTFIYLENFKCQKQISLQTK